MRTDWSLFVDLGLIAVALLGATALRARVKFLQRYLIPNALTAGFMLFPFYNWVAPLVGLERGGLESLVFHFLNITIIAMTLRPATGVRRRTGRPLAANSLLIVGQMTLQGLAGSALTWLLISTVAPDLFPGFGFLVTLGFVLGPGQAFAIGQSWEVLGFQGGGSIGLTFGAVGFLLACVGGIVLINLALRRGYLSAAAGNINLARSQTGLLPPGKSADPGMRLTTRSEAIDTMSVSWAVPLGVYLVTFLLLTLVTGALDSLGGLAATLGASLWGLSFIFALVIALGVRTLMRRTSLAHVMDAAALTRVSGGCVDFMMAAAVGAISITVVRDYWALILIFSAVVGLGAMYSIAWMSSRLFGNDHVVERTMDPELRTPAAGDYLVAAGATFGLVLPYVLIMNLPAQAYATGEWRLHLVSLAVMLTYALVIVIGFRGLAGKAAFRHPFRAWSVEPQGGDRL